ncbi:rRNA maturation RNase YbeY [soil metagenome]
MAITFSYADRQLTLKGKRRLKQFIASLFCTEGSRLNELSFVFCSDDYLLNINQRFLKHDFYTDIITFDLRLSSDEPVTGEVYISVDRVRENSKDLNTVFSEELLRVIFHGALHLCGYKDKRKSEILLMRQKEGEYLRLYQQTT